MDEGVHAEARDDPEDVDEAAEVWRLQRFVWVAVHEEQTGHLEEAPRDAADDEVLEVVRDVLDRRWPDAFVALHDAQPLLELHGDRGHAVADGVDHREREVDAEEYEEDDDARQLLVVELEADDAQRAQADVDQRCEEDVAFDSVVEDGELVCQVAEDRLEHPREVQQSAVAVGLARVETRHVLREGVVDQLGQRAVAGEGEVVVLVGPGERQLPDALLELRDFRHLSESAAEQVSELRAFRGLLARVYGRRCHDRVVARPSVSLSIHRINYLLRCES